MIRFEEYRKLDATAIAALVSSGEVSAKEILTCAIERCMQVNPRINAIVTPMYSNAHRYVDRHSLHGVLAGVPMVLKDLLSSFAGVPTSNGSRAYRFSVPQYHSTIVERLAHQGAVMIGKSNTPELGLLATTENSVFGPTRNPWNIQKSAGGSSGGTAAAIAAGMVPVGTAGDGGGSIRIPAACCGLFGLKPGRGLVPSGPDYGEVWDGAVSEHVITRSVRDSALILDILAGTDTAAHVQFRPGANGYLENLEKELPKLKIGFSTASPLGGEVDVECQSAVRSIATQLAALGHEVSEVVPDVLDPDALIRAYTDIYLSHVTADVALVERQFGKSYAKQYFEPMTYFISRLGKKFSAGNFVNSRKYWVQLQNHMAAFHRSFDLWITPVLSAPSYAIGAMRPSCPEELLMRIVSRSGLHRLIPVDVLYHFSALQLERVPFTQIANLTGQPAMSVPVAWSQDGLPIGVQFMAGANQEGLLLQMGRLLETLTPWFDRVPRCQDGSRATENI